ncbi:MULTISPECIES: hydrolase [unclassified Novosphingobium]|uniref:hydrolase n=1 Tax=unclassified Novosphingobium TaxID=2644732 RepID=UPI00061CAE60|nr:MULTISPECIES: hydrolase [unclassified Novosphingobium]GAO54748.1 acetylornithine deacetylase/Succinyl-diaminopimelate desuccinylase and related deacylases [Novosphingobium sp. MD-1]
MQQLSATERDLVGRFNADAMLSQVQAWSAVNTGTRNLDGLARQWDLLAGAFSDLPGEIRKVEPARVTAIAADGREEEVGHGAHFVLSVRPQAARRYLLTGHMDTVFPATHAFQQQRWLDDETLNGPGVADMKGGIAVILAALAAFETSVAAGNVGYDVMINSDEETGSLASAALIAELARGKAAALTYEPSALPDGTLAGARAGSGNFSLIVTGRSAHAGRNPQDGRNAIVAAADLALRLKHMETATLSVNPARIDGGSANNVVPDHAVLRFNIRPRAVTDADRFAVALRGLIAEIEREHEVSIHLHGGLSRPPKPLDPPAEALFGLVRDCGAALGQPIRWQSSGGVCDGNNIAALGVPVVDTMGVRGGAIHSPDEFLIVSSLAERAALSALVLHRLSGGN